MQFVERAKIFENMMPRGERVIKGTLGGGSW